MKVRQTFEDHVINEGIATKILIKKTPPILSIERMDGANN
jgi:hypothetical protein